MNKFLLIIPISLIILLSGCTQTQLSLNQTLSNIGQVNSFLSQYPNSTIQSALLSNPPQNLINQICGTNLTLSNVYFVNITSLQGNMLLLLNSTSNQVQCITVLTTPAIQATNNTANVNIGLSQGNLTGFISVGNTTTQVQANIGSNITNVLNVTVPTNLTGVTSVSTNVTGGNLSIIIQQGNLTQTILTNIAISNVTQAQQNNIIVMFNQTTGLQSNTTSQNVIQQSNQTSGSQSNMTSPTNSTQQANTTQTSGSNSTSNQTQQGNITTQSNQTVSGNQTSCITGWICTGTFERAYQYSNCSLGSTQYCNTTCSNGVC